MIARRVLILLAALLLAGQVIRNSAVAALADVHPQTAAQLWADHPAVELSLGLTEIAEAARARTSVAPGAFARIDRAAAKAPLAPEPFLVHGVRAQLAGDRAGAEESFVAAQQRDPRSLPAAYFLADHYFRAGQPILGVRQIAILARLSPKGLEGIAPYVAAYAQNRSNWPQIRALFKTEPGVEDSVMLALSADAANTDTILALSDPAHRTAKSPWLPQLLRKLSDAGQYARARAIWAAISGVRLTPGTLVYDTAFSDPVPPPPFNWTFTASTVGLAERQPGGHLHVLFYGQDDGVLASQLVLLQPGTYRLSLRLLGGGQNPAALTWSVRCGNSQIPVATAKLDQLAAHGMTFQIPANCPTQWLELSGRSADMPQQSDVTITAFSLNQAAPSV